MGRQAFESLTIHICLQIPGFPLQLEMYPQTFERAQVLPSEARAYLNLGRSTLYDLVRRGELPAVRFGKVLRIPREALKK